MGMVFIPTICGERVVGVSDNSGLTQEKENHIKYNPPTSPARRVKVLLRFSYLVSDISYSHTHVFVYSYLVSYSGGQDVEVGSAVSTTTLAQIAL